MAGFFLSAQSARSMLLAVLGLGPLLGLILGVQPGQVDVVLRDLWVGRPLRGGPDYVPAPGTGDNRLGSGGPRPLGGARGATDVRAGLLHAQPGGQLDADRSAYLLQ